jgi:hypothetical protein
VSRAPALDPLEERLTADKLGDALVIRPRIEGPIVLSRADLDRLRNVLGLGPEILGPAKTLRCCDQRPTSAVAAETDACGSRRTTRTPKRNARPRRAEQDGETSMRVSRLPSGPPKVSEAQLRTIVKRVLGQPEIKGYLRGLTAWGGDVSKIEGSVLKKLAHLAKPATKALKPSVADRIHDLAKKLAKEGNPVVRAELTRRIEFAKLEVEAEKKRAEQPFSRPALSTAGTVDRIAALRRKGGAR